MPTNGDMIEKPNTPGKIAGLREVAQEALHHLDQGVSIFDGDLNLVLFNEHFVELLEFPKEMVHAGTPFEELIRFNAKRGEYGPGDAEEQVRTRVERAENPTHHSYQRTRPDGTVIQIDGNPLPSGGVITTYTDITEKVQAAAFLRNIVEAQPAGFIVTRETDGQIAFGNHKIAEMCGYDFMELMTMRGRELYADPMERQALLDRCLRDDDVENIEATVKRKDGSTFPGLITLRHAHFQGHPCFFGWIVDVSRQKADWQGGEAKTDVKKPIDVNRLFLKSVEATKPRWSSVANVTIEVDNNLPMLNCFAKDLSAAIQVMILISCDTAQSKRASATEGNPPLARIHLTARLHDDGMRLTLTDDGAPLAFPAMSAMIKGNMGPGAELDINIEEIIKEKHSGAIAFEDLPSGNTIVLRMPTD